MQDPAGPSSTWTENIDRLTPREATGLLTLFDRFELQKPWLTASNAAPFDDGKAEALLQLSDINILEQNFIIQSKERLIQALNKLNLALNLQTKVADGKQQFAFTLTSINSTLTTSGELITLDYLRTLTKQLERHLAKEHAFDYVELAKQMLKGGVEMLAKTFPFLIDESSGKPLLEQAVEPQPILPEAEGSGMAAYEVNFQAAGRNIIIFPDANRFHKDHEVFWAETACRPNRLRSDYSNCVVYAILHELIHCIQYGTMGESTSANIWAKEYGACFAQMNIMAATAKFKPELFPPGLVEEIVLWYYEIVLRLHYKVMSEEMHEAYKRWRDSRGVQDPVTTEAAEFLWNNRAQGYYLKARLAVEAFDHAETFADFIDSHFGIDKRTSYPGNIPSVDRDTTRNDLVNVLSVPVSQRKDLDPVDWSRLWQ
jgi:hypothetical protein